MNQDNKISLHYDRGFKFRGHRPNNWIGAPSTTRSSDVVQTKLAQLHRRGQVDLDRDQPAAGRGVVLHAAGQLQPVIRAGRGPAPSPPTTDSLGLCNVSPREDFDTARMFTYSGGLSYVTGAHNFKTGVQARTGWSQEQFTAAATSCRSSSTACPTRCG